VFSFDGNEFHVEAQVGAPPEFADYLNRRGRCPNHYQAVTSIA